MCQRCRFRDVQEVKDDHRPNERRKFNNETDEVVRDKIIRLLECGLEVMVCIGEVLEERESGNTMAVIRRQVDSFLDVLSAEQLKKISIAAQAGEVVVILGPNGHGKSTLLKAICGLVERVEGAVTYRGEDILGQPTDRIVNQGITL